MAPANDKLLAEATASLERMQKFNVTSLPRKEELGTSLNFDEVVEPASLLIDLHRRLTPAALADFPVNQLSAVKQAADEHFNMLNQILTFNPDQANPGPARKSLIDQVRNAYQPAFGSLHGLIAYSLHRSADFQRLDREARATAQAIEDKAGELGKRLEAQLQEAERIVEDVRKVAAETGVSQQATYFKQEADKHDTDSEKWRKRAGWWAVALGVYGVVSLFLAKVPWLRPEDAYQSVQLAVSKVLIFAVLSFMLYLAARSYLSHRHNAIVNRHRQNALLTYRALVDAAGQEQSKEVVLTHAAACIFAPQATGYTQEGGDIAKASSVVEILGKPLAGK